MQITTEGDKKRITFPRVMEWFAGDIDASPIQFAMRYADKSNREQLSICAAQVPKHETSNRVDCG